MSGLISPQIIVCLVVSLICMICSSNTSSSRGAGEPKIIGCVEAERQALLKIKQDLHFWNGSAVPVLSSWGSEKERRDCCKWPGVRCSNKSGNVISLDLSPSTFGTSYYEPTLTGKLSPALFELPYLTYLDLSFINFYTSQIPSSIGTLRQLRHLNLSGTLVGGETPPQLANLSSLEVLDLGYNDLLVTTKILETASRLSSLRILVLSQTNLSTASDWVQRVNQLSGLTNLLLAYCNLPNISDPSSLSLVNSSRSLSILDLSNNFISISIMNFSKMTAMKHLDLSSNALNGYIPEAFSTMMALTYLDLSYNNLRGSIPEIFRNMIALEYLDLGYNRLEGQIPSSIWKLSKLRTLRMCSNNLSGHLPRTTFQKLKQIENLDISRNSLGGVISEAGFENLSKLHDLDLSCNSLTLDIHSDWVPPFQLQFLLLASCKLGPLFPKWLQTQKKYIQLDISNSGISDSIPNSFWDSLSSNRRFLGSDDLYRYVNFSNNQIKGEIGNILLEFQENNWEIDLSSNQLEGSVPASLLFQVVALYLSHNRFSKLTFRCNITGDAGHLIVLDVSYNQLDGELPDCWSQFEGLGALILTYNNLSGKIPSSLGSVKAMTILQLANNNFVGELPTTLKNCKKLIVVDVGRNNLSGPIPLWMASSSPELIILSLRSNHFSRTIPSSICLWPHLQLLDLSSNEITGSIPKCINRFAAITSTTSNFPGYLKFRMRWLMGDKGHYEFRAQVEWKGKLRELESTLDFLKSIDLSSNKLTGEIPREITDLTGLHSLNLSRNRLSGQIPSEIGRLTTLDALDLSWNHLRGQIPPSLTRIDRLNALDLSNNKLSGKIPTSTQLQSFPTAYMGNPELCGDPLPNKCPDDVHETMPGATLDEADHELLTRGFYISMAIGFVVAFWGFCGSLIFHKPFRYAYFRLLNDAGDWVCVMAAIHKARLLGMIKS